MHWNRYSGGKRQLAQRFTPMQYLPLFLLFMAALIAAYFYLQRAKTRGNPEATTPVRDDTPSSSPPTDTAS